MFVEVTLQNECSKGRIESMVIICQETDPSSICQDTFNSQSFPIHGLALDGSIGLGSPGN